MKRQTHTSSTLAQAFPKPEESECCRGVSTKTVLQHDLKKKRWKNLFVGRANATQWSQTCLQRERAKEEEAQTGEREGANLVTSSSCTWMRGDKREKMLYCGITKVTWSSQNNKLLNFYFLPRVFSTLTWTLRCFLSPGLKTVPELLKDSLQHCPWTSADVLVL